MPHTVRSFERHDRDRLTELVNLHHLGGDPEWRSRSAPSCSSSNGATRDDRRSLVACDGVRDTWPHISSLYSGAGSAPVREETVFAVPCADLNRPWPESWEQRRSVGTLGQFDLSQDGTALGYIEVCQLRAELARSNASGAGPTTPSRNRRSISSYSSGVVSRHW